MIYIVEPPLEVSTVSKVASDVALQDHTVEVDSEMSTGPDSIVSDQEDGEVESEEVEKELLSGKPDRWWL